MKKNNESNYKILIAVIAFLVGVVAMLLVSKYGPKSVQTIVNKSEKEVTITDSGIADAVEKVYDSVVVVGSYKKGVLASSGSGFVYDSDDKYAYILTNSHVVTGSNSIKVKFTNENIEDVELVGNDPYSDIAVLKIEKEKVVSIASLGSTKNMRVGDTVFAIGAPVDSEYSWSVTRGIVSGKERLIEVSSSTSNSNTDFAISVIQTDTAINSGNSGGPLANTNGEIIGITNMKLVSDGVEGMGFAIPIDDAIEYAKKLRENGELERPFLGISMLNTTDLYALQRYGVVLEANLEGAVVIETEKNTPASNAGLKLGDCITKIDDYKVTSVAKLKYYLFKYMPNDEVTLTYVRNNKEEQVKVKLSKAES